MSVPRDLPGIELLTCFGTDRRRARPLWVRSIWLGRTTFALMLATMPDDSFRWSWELPSSRMIPPFGLRADCRIGGIFRGRLILLRGLRAGVLFRLLRRIN